MLLYLVTFSLVAAQFLLPRPFSMLALLIAIFHLGNRDLVTELTPVRLVIITGLLRAWTGGFLQWSFYNRLDKLFVLFCIVALLSSLGHESNEYVPSPFLERCGLILNVLGSYLYGRAYLTGPSFVSNFAICLAVVLIPFAALLAYEQTTGKNAYVHLGSRGEFAGMRNDRLRAKGPFGHAILAGTAAAVALPFMVLLVRRNKRALGFAGLAAAVVGSVASASSGPIAALIAVLTLLGLWRLRHRLVQLQMYFILLLIFLHFARTRPIWFLIARFDIVGGSTGWHRAKLMDSAIKNLNEWWLTGTDYTRHWMHSGVTWNHYHTDITNYYLQMGVLGGLPLMITFIAIIVTSLRRMERVLPVLREAGDPREFEVWCIWTAILASCLSFFSIAYFDQSYAAFFLLIGAAPGVAAWADEAAQASDEEDASAQANWDRPVVAPL